MTRSTVGSASTRCGAPTTAPASRCGFHPGVPTSISVLRPTARCHRRSRRCWVAYAIIGTVLAEHTPAEPHWYLQLLATHPDWQRQGVGAALMGSMFERAAAEGLPCYLETETIGNVAYYRHHGFEVRSEWDVPTGPHMWGMFRPT